MASNPNISTPAPTGLAAATAAAAANATSSSSSSSVSNPSLLNHPQHIPLRSKSSDLSQLDESADMTATATLHMQDLDVTDGNNTTSSVMRFKTTATPEPMELSNGRKFGEEPPPSTYLRQVLTTQNPLPAGLRPSQANGLTTLASQQGFDEETRQRYCYRHRPDLWNGRQVEEPSMDQLKAELSSVPEAERQGISEVWSSFSKAPAKQRELMLRGLLAQCCFPQLSFLAGSVRELLKIDFLSALPPELGLRILCFLDSRSLCHAAQVSRKWKEMADDDVVWHRMCEQHIDRKCTTCGWGLPLLDRERLRSERRNLHMRLVQETAPLPTTHTKSAISHTEIYEYPDSASDDNEHGPTPKSGKKRGAAAVMPANPVTVKKSCTPAHNYEGAEQYFSPATQQILAPRPWKDVYRDRFKIGTNWKHGRCTLKVLKGHTNGVMCLQFDDQIIVSGSYDTTIRIWDIESGELLRTLTGHTLGVKCLQFDKSKLVSGSLDGTLKMWDIKTGKVIRTFPGHSGAVISVHFDGSILASGSQDKTIRVRDFANCSRVSLRGHTDWVNSVRVDAASQTLFSASDDCTVRIWDLAAKRCVRVLRDHSAQVQQVLPLPYGFEVEGNLDNSESDSDSSSSQASSSSTSSARSVAVPIAIPDRLKYHGHDPPRYILTGSLDSTIRLWEVSTGRCIRTFFGHIEGIWALAADTLRMVSGANDGLVKIWDPRTGKHERTISGHDGPVTCVGLSDRRLVTGSEDTEIRLYNFENTAPDPLKTAISATPAPPPTSKNKQEGDMEL